MKTKAKAVAFGTLAAGASCLAGASAAAVEPPDLRQCQAIADREQRLDCFDRVAAGQAAPAVATPSGLPASGASAAAQPPQADTPARYSMARHWELGEGDKRGVFSFRPHRDNYVLFANYATQPNSAPYREAGRLGPDEDLANTEVAFQLGFKLKLAENAFRSPVDVWFGYTQNSFWAAYNDKASSPFRETNYQPELMAVVPPVTCLAGHPRARHRRFRMKCTANAGGPPLRADRASSSPPEW